MIDAQEFVIAIAHLRQTGELMDCVRVAHAVWVEQESNVQWEVGVFRCDVIPVGWEPFKSDESDYIVCRRRKPC